MVESAGSADELHRRALPEPMRPSVWVHHVERPALVLGSTQREDVLAAAATGGEDDVEVCRRRSGGGLVTLLPGNDLWIDVILPRSSPLWVDDVGLAGEWLGEVWAAALRAVLPATLPAHVHRGALQARQAGRLLCFAGIGPGEVRVAGRKIVGLSQRRTRAASRFQTVMTWSWPGRWVSPMLTDGALHGAGLDRSAVVDLAAGLPPTLLDSTDRPTVEASIAAFLDHLPPP